MPPDAHLAVLFFIPTTFADNIICSRQKLFMTYLLDSLVGTINRVIKMTIIQTLKNDFLWLFM